LKKVSDLQTRDLIVTVVEKNLLKMGKRNHDKIVNYLKKEHRCDISDCYLQPEILSLALKKHLGDKAGDFIKLMTRDLEKINHNSETEHFLKTIQQH